MALKYKKTGTQINGVGMLEGVPFEYLNEEEQQRRLQAEVENEKKEVPLNIKKAEEKKEPGFLVKLVSGKIKLSLNRKKETTEELSEADKAYQKTLKTYAQNIAKTEENYKKKD